MSRITPMPFQERHVKSLVERFRAVKNRYDALKKGAGNESDALRLADACVLLQAPTGIGKTLIACEVLSRFSAEENVLWLWFAPFAGVIDQAKRALTSQAPSLTQLDVESDRRAETRSCIFGAAASGGLFHVIQPAMRRPIPTEWRYR